jgi:hypothetical protein
MIGIKYKKNMKILIGSTGLIGTTLKESIKFDYEFNSKTINYFLNNDYMDVELYLSCLPATKWLVNKNIPEDIKNIENIINIITKKTYKKVILISTIDVYCDSPLMIDESSGRYPIIKKFDNIISCFTGKIQGVYIIEDKINNSFIESNLKHIEDKKINLEKIDNVYKTSQNLSGHLNSLYYLNCSYPERILQKKLKDYMLIESKNIKVNFRR